MDNNPRFDVCEAVARFFPAGTAYDRDNATRMIKWLDSCGYRIVAKSDAEPTADTNGGEAATEAPARQRSH